MRKLDTKIDVEDAAVGTAEFNKALGSVEITISARAKNIEASISIVLK